MPEIPAHIRRFCRDVLRQYPLMQRELEALEEEKQAIAGTASVAAWQEPVRVKAVGDRTARQAFRLLRLEERWRQARFYVQAVEDLLSFLDDERRRLVEMHYFNGQPAWKVYQELGIDRSTFYRYQAAILALLAHRLGL